MKRTPDAGRKGMVPELMKKHRRMLERAKTAVIAALIISAVLLGAETEMFNQFLGESAAVTRLFHKGSDRRSLPLATVANTDGAGEAAMPVFAAVTGADGVHCAVKYSAAAIRDIYENTGSTLGEAIGSALGEHVVSENEWKGALKSLGFYYDYLNEIELSVLSSWLGVQAPDGMSGRLVRRICVASDGETAKLYYKDENSGGFYCCTTAVQSSGLGQFFNQYPPNGALFAFEAEKECGGADPYTLILREQTKPTVYKTENPVSKLISEDEIISAFGINPYSSYAESDGTQVFVETNCSLRVGADGSVLYVSTGSAGEKLNVSYTDLSSAVECARGFVAGLIGKSCGEAEVYLVSAESSDGVYTLSFAYFIDSVPVHLRNGESAAKIVLEDGRISSASLLFRSYSALDEKSYVMPEEQAAAALTGGTEPVLCYMDSGEENAKADWIKG